MYYSSTTSHTITKSVHYYPNMYIIYIAMTI